jgi:cell division septum initiation protein DivIVA
VDTEPRQTAGQETPTHAAARMLEVAAVTAETLVSDAEHEAAALVKDAQEKADAILRASRTESDRVAGALARTKQEQTAELERERVTTLGDLNEKKAAIESQITQLREMESLHRDQLRRALTEQLTRLDSSLPGPPDRDPTQR